MIYIQVAVQQVAPVVQALQIVRGVMLGITKMETVVAHVLLIAQHVHLLQVAQVVKPIILDLHVLHIHTLVLVL